MPETLRQATVADADHLVELMREFYAEAGYSLDPHRARIAFAQMLDDSRLGRIWILEQGGALAGYVVLTLGYSMEYGGRDGFVDDLFVRSAFRGRGLGKLALAQVRAACLDLGVRALHLEVGPDNEVALDLYRKAGFAGTGRRLLTLRLASPTHQEPS